MKRESDAQTFKKQVGKSVLCKDLSVYFDPTMKNLEGQDLNGYYKYDDQGSKALKVSVVEAGVLKNFLMSRCPIENFSTTNGHARAQAGRQPVTRQSNLIVRTSHPNTMEELKTEIERRGKEPGQGLWLSFPGSGRRVYIDRKVPAEFFQCHACGSLSHICRRQTG